MVGGCSPHPNNSFKPILLRGLVFAVTFTATLGRYAGRLNSGVRPVLKGQGLQLKSKPQSNKRTRRAEKSSHSTMFAPAYSLAVPDAKPGH